MSTLMNGTQLPPDSAWISFIFNPIHKGIYKVRHARSKLQPKNQVNEVNEVNQVNEVNDMYMWSYWDGSIWCLTSDTPEHALAWGVGERHSASNDIRNHVYDAWCGLSEKVT